MGLRTRIEDFRSDETDSDFFSGSRWGGLYDGSSFELIWKIEDFFLSAGIDLLTVIWAGEVSGDRFSSFNES